MKARPACINGHRSGQSVKAMAGFASLEMNRTTAPTTSPNGRIPSPANAALQQGLGHHPPA